VKGQAILGPSHPITGKFLPLPTLAISTGEAKSMFKNKERKSVRRLRWMKSEVFSPLGLADQSGVWLRWENPHRTQQNSTQQQAFFFLWYKELKTNSLPEVKRWKHSFISSFPRPPRLFSVTVYPNEADDRRGWAEKTTTGLQQHWAIGSIVSSPVSTDLLQ